MIWGLLFQVILQPTMAWPPDEVCQAMCQPLCTTPSQYLWCKPCSNILPAASPTPTPTPSPTLLPTTTTTTTSTSSTTVLNLGQVCSMYINQVSALQAEKSQCLTNLSSCSTALQGKTNERDACMSSLGTSNAEISRLNLLITQLNAQLVSKQKLLSCLKSKCSNTYKKCGGR